MCSAMVMLFTGWHSETRSWYWLFGWKEILLRKILEDRSLVTYFYFSYKYLILFISNVCYYFASKSNYLSLCWLVGYWIQALAHAKSAISHWDTFSMFYTSWYSVLICHSSCQQTCDRSDKSSTSTSTFSSHFQLEV